MKLKVSNRMISYLFAFSSILLALACFTITKSFSMPESSEGLKKWNVYLDGTDTRGSNGNVIVSHDSFNVSLALSNHNETYQVNTKIKNDGGFNARLESIDITNLSNIKIGTSLKTGVNYYLSDYVSLSFKYAKDNKSNNVYVDSDVLKDDLLKMGTSNDVVLLIKYKDLKEINADALEVFNDNVKVVSGGRVIRFNVNVSMHYVEAY